MKTRLLAVAAAGALLLGVAACGPGEDPGDDPNASGELTVWLQVEAQNLWPEAVAAATKKFNETYPNVTVTAAYHGWPDHLGKFDAATQAGTAPDVVEMGTTEMALYMSVGAFTDLTGNRAEFDSSDAWVEALETSATYQGKLYGVPYYGGDRAVIYRKDLLAEVGVNSPPKTWQELMDAIGKLNEAHKDDPTFSSFFLPGQHQYAAMPFVYDAGGQAALETDGKWDATFSSPEGIAGLKNWKALMDAGYRGDRTINDLTAFSTMVAGKAAMFYDTSGHLNKVFGADGDPALKEHVGSFQLPSPSRAGGFVPAFMGGSDLAVPASSEHADWARAWIAAYTSTENSRAFVDAGFLANTAAIKPDDPQLQGYVDSLSDTWTLPAAKNWAQVEKSKIVLNMLVDIATEKATVEDATAAADAEIEKILNAE